MRTLPARQRHASTHDSLPNTVCQPSCYDPATRTATHARDWVGDKTRDQDDRAAILASRLKLTDRRTSGEQPRQRREPARSAQRSPFLERFVEIFPVLFCLFRLFVLFVFGTGLFCFVCLVWFVLFALNATNSEHQPLFARTGLRLSPFIAFLFFDPMSGVRASIVRETTLPHKNHAPSVHWDEQYRQLSGRQHSRALRAHKRKIRRPRWSEASSESQSTEFHCQKKTTASTHTRRAEARWARPRAAAQRWLR